MLKGIGIELEGGWEDPPGQTHTSEEGCDCGCPNCNATIDSEWADNEGEGEWHGDSSVDTEGTCGEFVSPIIRKPFGRNIDSFVTKFYPDHVNATCGMHIHLGLPAGAVGLMMDDAATFHDGMLAALRAWGERHNIRNRNFWDRLEGENSFCEPIFSTTERYSAVNFTAWDRHKTVEIRVLPMFKESRISTMALRFVVAYVQRWCRNNIGKIEATAPTVRAHDDGQDNELLISAIEFSFDGPPASPDIIDVPLPPVPLSLLWTGDYEALPEAVHYSEPLSFSL